MPADQKTCSMCGQSFLESGFPCFGFYCYDCKYDVEIVEEAAEAQKKIAVREGLRKLAQEKRHADR